MPASRIALLALVVSFPLVAVAQPRTEILVGGLDAGFANASQCGDTQAVTYTITLPQAACSDFRVWATAGTCGNTPDAGDFTIGTVTQTNVPSQLTGSMTFEVQELPAIDGGCGAPVDQTFQLCGKYQYTSITGCTTDAPYSTMPVGASFRYDAVPPDAPAIEGVSSLDGALRLDIAVTEDTVEVQVEYRTRADADAGVGGGASTGWTQGPRIAVGQPFRVENLANSTTYEVRARSFDGADNVSAYSDTEIGTPEPLYGFGDAYIAAGGRETGGCSAGGLGGGLWVMLLVPALLGLWRRLR